MVPRLENLVLTSGLLGVFTVSALFEALTYATVHVGANDSLPQ